MKNTHRKERKDRKSRKSRKGRKQGGGGLGGGWGFSPAAWEHTVNNSVSHESIGNCREAVRPGFLSGGVTMRGLPGMTGGKRKGLKGRKTNKSRKVMKGGRYGFDPTLATEIGGAPWGSAYAPVSRIPCEASRAGIPDDGASGQLNVQGGPLWTGSGGASPLTADHGPTSSSPYIDVPTARYTHFAGGTPGDISTAAGTKLMIHTPLNAAQMNPACLKTGGGKRKSKSKSRKSKKGRKGIKGIKGSKGSKGRKH